MKYIALDIGNVICHANMDKFIGEISETFNISIDEATRFLRSFQQMHDLGLTNMESQLRVWFDCKSEITSKKLIEHWCDSIKPNPVMCSTLVKLLDANVQVALLSNIGIEHAELIEHKMPGIYNRAIKHFSCFVGARKPSMLYYQSFLLQHPEFKGCLYVDDLLENLEASKQFGFQPYHFSLEQPGISYQVHEIEKIILKTE